MTQTEEQYTNILANCREIFEKKTADYGTSWRILRPSSLTDQLFIKAQRIRTIQETGENKVGESVEGEFMAIVNYCIMALIQSEKDQELPKELSKEESSQLYAEYAERAYELMLKKNHDYGEAWRDMRVSSLTDLILTKILRIKQIEDNKGKTIASEGVAGNYYDMLNYAVFSLIHLSENN